MVGGCVGYGSLDPRLKTGVCARICITALVTTKTYHEESLTLRDDDYDGEPLGERSHVLPWSLATLNSPAEVDYDVTRLTDERTADVVAQLVGYISS